MLPVTSSKPCCRAMAAIIGSAKPMYCPVRFQVAGNPPRQLGGGAIKDDDLFQADRVQEVE